VVDELAIEECRLERAEAEEEEEDEQEEGDEEESNEVSMETGLGAEWEEETAVEDLEKVCEVRR